MTHVLGTVLALALVVASQPAAKPNFSGEWKFNVAKSNFGALPPPTAMSRTITHAEPAMTIVESQEGGMGDPTVTRKYVNNGPEGSFTSQGAEVATAAKWVGNVLEVTSRVDSIGLSIVDKMSLSPDGKTLTSEVQVSSAQGNVEITIVFDKQ